MKYKIPPKQKSKQPHHSKPSHGITMIEVLIVVAIIGMLAITLFSSMRGQRQKATDASQIADIEKLKVAFEDYYNDHNCYPPATYFDSSADCNSNELAPYLMSMPCGNNGLPYLVTTDVTGCSAYQIGAVLERPTGVSSCLQGAGYCSSSANFSPSIPLASPLPQVIGSSTPAPSSTVAPTPTPSPSSLPTPTPPVNTYYYCSGINNCTRNFTPDTKSCDPAYLNDPNCGNTGCPIVSTCTNGQSQVNPNPQSNTIY